MVKSLYFVNLFKDVLNNKELNIKEKNLEKRYKEFQEMYVHANDYIARINNKGNQEVANQLISYIYVGLVKDYLIEYKHKDNKIDLSKFDKNYILEYKTPLIGVLRKF